MLLFYPRGARVTQAVQGNDVDSATSASKAEWMRVLGQLKAEIGDDAFRNWLQPISLRYFGAGQAVVTAPSRFLRDWVTTHYADRLLVLWQAGNERGNRVSIVVSASPSHAVGGHSPCCEDAGPPPGPAVADTTAPIEIG